MPQQSPGILVVEDEAVLRGVIVKVLQRRGFAIFEADSFAKGLNLSKEKKDEIQLVITDYFLDDKHTGFNLLEQLRAEKAELKCILMSGLGEHALPDRAANDLFLLKPFTATQLVEAVSRLLHQG